MLRGRLFPVSPPVCQLKVEVGDKVVYCPDRPSKFRGAIGTVINRTVKKARKVLTAFCMRWEMFRKGVCEIRLRGRPREKSNSVQWDDPKHNTGPYFRRQQEPDGLHPSSYCNNCPLRLARLVAPCPVHMTKSEAMKRYGRKGNSSRTRG